MPADLLETELVTPAFLSVPDYAYTLGPEVAELAEMAGFPPDPEQRLCLDAIFAYRADGKPAASRAAVIAPRQNIKTGLFKQCALGWLFVTDERLVVWSAHEFSTAQESHRDLTELVEGSDVLRARVKTITRGNGDEGIEMMSGQRVKFKARTKTGGRGLSGDKIVLDEAFALQPTHMGSLKPTTAARPHAQILYGSSAGREESAVLRGVRDRGQPGLDPRLFYVEWADDLEGECETPDCRHGVGSLGCRLDDEKRWHRANTQLGRRITLEYVRDERADLTPEEFARERLGWWDEDPAVGGVFDVGVWDSRRNENSAIVGAVQFGLAVAEDRSWSCIGVAGSGPFGTHVEVTSNDSEVDYRPGTDWVMDRLKELNKNAPGSSVVVKPSSPAGALLPKIEAAAIPVELMSAQEYAQACGAIYDAVVAGEMVHLGQPMLDMAVRSTKKRNSSEAFVWDARKSDRDISPWDAVTCARWGFVKGGPSVYEDRGLIIL